MTLRQWSLKYNAPIGLHADMRWIPDNMGGEMRTALWHLTDYAVASVSGGTIWLRRCSTVPRYI